MNHDLAVGLFITISLEVVLHWFPWPCRLKRLAAYVLGVGAILAGITYWLNETGHRDLIWPVWSFAIAAGAAVFLCYGIDWLVLMIRKALKAEAVDDGLR